MMDRRGFLVTLAAGVATGTRGAFAQPRVPRVGLVSAGTRSFEALLKGLRDAGYVPGQTIIVEHRRTEGRVERYSSAVDSILKTDVDVIVVGSAHGLTAARTLTRTLPIVAVDLESDPVASGFVASLARPGGNVTGFFLDLPAMSGKQLQLLKEAAPGVIRVAALYDAVIGRPQVHAAETAGRAVGVTIRLAPVQKAGDLETAIESVVRDGAPRAARALRAADAGESGAHRRAHAPLPSSLRDPFRSSRERQRLHVVRPGPGRNVRTERIVRGSHPQGRPCRRFARGAAVEVRVRREPADGKGLEAHHSSFTAPARRSGGRVATNRARVSVEQPDRPGHSAAFPISNGTPPARTRWIFRHPHPLRHRSIDIDSSSLGRSSRPRLEIELRSPLRIKRASVIASRRSVFTRSPASRESTRRVNLHSL